MLLGLGCHHHRRGILVQSDTYRAVYQVGYLCYLVSFLASVSR